MTENEIARQIVDVAFKIPTALGPGLLKAVYEAGMADELTKRGLYVVRQQAIPITWESIQLEEVFRADLIVEGRVLVEIKSVDAIAPAHGKQLLIYLKLPGKGLGLSINFNVDLIRDGIQRVVNRLPE